MVAPSVLCLLLLAVPYSANHISEEESAECGRSARSLNSKYRPIYHITALKGWINDATGFVKYRNQYHIFYLYHPYNGAWGHTGWGHIVSDSLLDWIHSTPALAPKNYYEKHGCLAGSALVHNDYLTLFYTGNVIANNKTRQTQNIAISSDGVVFQKFLYNPIIKESPNGAGGFRNPKVWRYENSWYMLVGASRKHKGQLLLYTSPDMFHWKLKSVVAESLGDMGYMWENPDLFELDGMHVLIFCARGVQADGNRFRNQYQTGFLVGRFDYDEGKFRDPFEISTATYNILDYGHDFYAPHTMLDSDGRRLLIAWLGMWGSNYEEIKEGWASMLTTVRELSLSREGVLLMRPARELTELRAEVLEDAWYMPGEKFPAGCKAFELLVKSSENANHAVIVLDWGGEGRFTVEYHAAHGYVAIHRGGIDGGRRTSWLPPNDQVRWRIFFDYSSVEVFCGDGEVVFSSRVYPRRVANIKVLGDTGLHILQYRLRRSVGHEQEKQLIASPYSD
ncbi:raffinose invertase [Phthorimaea operculella]|nr:raffinose invertase [Phthorimaea operculella]